MNVRALVAELIGTFILVGVGSLSILSAGASSVPATLIVPFGFSFALLAGIVLFGQISGAHFNPAVTLAAWIDRRLNLVNAIGYLVAQAIGAVLGSMAMLMFGKDFVDLTRNTPSSAVNDFQAFGIEAVLTAIFVAVILSVTARAATQAVFVIPLTLALIHFAAIPITGASVNPARALAPAIVAGNYEHLWVYLTAPFLGALIGWGLYRLMGDDLTSGVPEEGEDDFLDDLDDARPSPAPR
jgi:aquaporin Z